MFLYLQRIHHPEYNNELTQFLPRTVVLKKPPGAQLGFNIRGGKASQLGIFISKVCVCLCIALCFVYTFTDFHVVPFLKNVQNLYDLFLGVCVCDGSAGGSRLRCPQSRATRGRPGSLCEWGWFPGHWALKSKSETYRFKSSLYYITDHISLLSKNCLKLTVLSTKRSIPLKTGESSIILYFIQLITIRILECAHDQNVSVKAFNLSFSLHWPQQLFTGDILFIALH